MRNLHRRIIAMGKLKDDDIFAVILINSMNTQFGHMQQSVVDITMAPSHTSEAIAHCILQEDAMICQWITAGQPGNPNHTQVSSVSASAFPAVSNWPCNPRPICANCKRDNHSTDYCILPRGKMQGKTIEEARAAFCVAMVKASAQNQPTCPSGNRIPRQDNQPSQSSVHIADANVPTTPSPVTSPAPPSPHSPFSNSQTILLHGIPYIIDPTFTATNSTDDQQHQAHLAIAPVSPASSSNSSSVYQYHAYIACTDSPSTLTSTLSSAPLVRTADPNKMPFILDTGASCHISPILSDFKNFHPIEPHPISGLGNLSVLATGVGTIVLTSPSGVLTLNNAFFVPTSAIRLISVFTLNKDNNYGSYFDPRSCLITDKQGNIVAQSTAIIRRRLYILSNFSVPLAHPPAPSHAHYASRLPDIDSWHKCLGHCGVCAVMDMARQGVVEGMQINTSRTPPKCEHCVLGKQTCSLIPKVREGARSKLQLEHVYIDLCRPMSIPSRSSHLYSMNIVDDFSSFMWSLPLRSKDEAAPTLKAWLTALELQTPHRLKSFVSDNSELATSQIKQWCTDQGILHLFTAPYTSAHNGWAERLHHTLMDKA